MFSDVLFEKFCVVFWGGCWNFGRGAASSKGVVSATWHFIHTWQACQEKMETNSAWSGPEKAQETTAMTCKGRFLLSVRENLSPGHVSALLWVPWMLWNLHPWRCSEDTWARSWATWTSSGCWVHPPCSWGFGNVSLGPGQTVPLRAAPFLWWLWGEFPESSARASARTDPLPQELLLSWCSCPCILPKQSCLCLTVPCVDLDWWISFLTWPETCFVRMDLSSDHWTVGHPGYCL